MYQNKVIDSYCQVPFHFLMACFYMNYEHMQLEEQVPDLHVTATLYAVINQYFNIWLQYLKWAFNPFRSNSWLKTT